MFKVKYQNKEIQYERPTRLTKIVEDLALTNVLAATTNGRLRELNYVLSKDVNLQFLGYENADAIKMYEATLRYVVAMAIFRLYPKAKIKFNYSISRSILAVFDVFEETLNQTILNNIKQEIDRIIEANYTIFRKKVSLQEGIDLYHSFHMNDKVDILKYRDENYVNLYECDGYVNYMFGYMLPSTGSLKDYQMFLYHPGFIIQYPRAEFNGKIPQFKDEPMFGYALKEAHYWGKITKGNTIPRMNEYAKTKDLTIDFIHMCETKHQHQLYELGEKISDNKSDIRLIAIAGPSSSGKTTFSNRLRIELKSRGIHPVMISIDDYYLGRSSAPKNEDGSPDLEHVNALDIALFNQDMLSLIQGEEVILPRFNFKTGLREQGRKVKVNHDTPIIIEGIHALNELLTRSIPKHQKFKIYIAPQTQLHIDNHCPISITDLRLLRRLVRDQKYRNSSAVDTLSMWPSVRRGEFKWIYPYQNDADYVFNSELSYELMVLKKHAITQLNAIDTESPYFITANRLVKFLKYFVDIDDQMIPNHSILREFIGGSPFHD